MLLLQTSSTLINIMICWRTLIGRHAIAMTARNHELIYLSVCVDSSNIFVPLLEGSTILPDLSCLVIQHLYAGIFDSLVGHAGAALYTN